MTFDDLKDIAEKDLVIDDLDLHRESTRTIELTTKYLRFYSEFNMLKKNAEFKYKKMYREKWEYYMGKAEPQVYQEKPFDLKVLKQDVPMYLDADDDLLNLKAKIAYYEEITNYLENCIKAIKDRTWSIRAAIDWRKFTEGMT
jgi:hypothetical protein